MGVDKLRNEIISRALAKVGNRTDQRRRKNFKSTRKNLFHQHLGLAGLIFVFLSGECIAEWPDKDMAGKRVLIPRAKEAREVLPEKLAEMGALVQILPVYETKRDDSAAEAIRA